MNDLGRSVRGAGVVVEVVLAEVVVDRNRFMGLNLLLPGLR